jgi:hypothetical protein
MKNPDELRVLKNVQFFSRSRKKKNLSTGIHPVFRELKFESDIKIGQNGGISQGSRVAKRTRSLICQK